jgi:hypothetical protein
LSSNFGQSFIRKREFFFYGDRWDRSDNGKDDCRFESRQSVRVFLLYRIQWCSLWLNSHCHCVYLSKVKIPKN